MSNQLNDNFGYGVGFNVSVPIFNRFQTRNRVAQSVINKEVFEIRLESEKVALKQTIEQAFLDVKSALKTYETAKISLGAQEEAFKNAQERYNFGAMTQFDFLEIPHHVFPKMIKNDQIIKLCLGVKPPYEKMVFRHMVKFWKRGILMGG